MNVIDLSVLASANVRREELRRSCTRLYDAVRCRPSVIAIAIFRDRCSIAVRSVSDHCCYEFGADSRITDRPCQQETPTYGVSL